MDDYSSMLQSLAKAQKSNLKSIVEILMVHM